MADPEGSKSIYIHVERVMAILCLDMTPVQIGKWMKTRHPQLRMTPADALLKGKVGNVITAANKAVGLDVEKELTGV